MSSLTKIAYYTRKAIILGIIGMISFLILKGLLNLGINQWQASHPNPTPAPNVLFGKLSEIKFPQSKYSYPQDFVLEIIGGQLPEASSSAKVYQIPKKLPSLLASRRAQEFANRLEFKNGPVSKTPTEYSFIDPKTPLKTLDIDIVNYNFVLKYDYLKDEGVFQEGSPPQPQQAKDEANKFFQSTNNFPPDFRQGEIKTTLLRFSGKELLPATSLSKTNVIRVDFLRSGVEGVPVLPPEFDQSSVFAIVSGSRIKEKKIIWAEFEYFEPNYQTSASYPIKTINQAWEELKTGQGFISRWQKNKQRAIIREAYLAYYDAPEYQNYLQPIFVFEGDEEFVAYVPALATDWLE
ncbi:hypothetical protein ISS85_02520 [Candidatus Microgenomates bacterium]|nr:hypothetical protein [Candidatus Microgenomates bacterium]